MRAVVSALFVAPLVLLPLRSLRPPRPPPPRSPELLPASPGLGGYERAFEAVLAEGHEIVGVTAILDRLSGGAEAIDAASGGAPYRPLCTIDDVYPDRPDRSTGPDSSAG